MMPVSQKRGRGRPRLEPAPTALELFEAFCCEQLVRVESKLNNRYAEDGHAAVIGRRPGTAIAQVRRNDHMGRFTIDRDCSIERRG